MQIPDHLVYPLVAFGDAFLERMNAGAARLKNARVAFVGLARNCGDQLANNLKALENFVPNCGSWKLHIESNDSHDNTREVLEEFCTRHHEASYRYQVLGRGNYSAEFAGRRTIAMAEYRTACQQWVRQHAADADYVIVIDWDQWGGWSFGGLLNGIGWLDAIEDAYGMASVGLFQHNWGDGPRWAHYDLWALRGVGQMDCYWDQFQNQHGGWGYMWLPPIGSPPVLVSSAFGGLAVYKTAAFLQGTYDGTKDCEHVPFHRSIAKATGQRLYLCPAMRCVMQWIPEEAADAGQHRDD